MIRVVVFISILLAGCFRKEQQSILDKPEFRLPVISIYESMDTVKPLSANRIQSIYPEFIGQYKIGDTIHYKGETEYKNISEKEYLWEVKDINITDSLSSDGLQIIPDYSTSLPYERYYWGKHLYYPVYVVNQTSVPKVFFGKDNHGYAIQEAIDTSYYSLWFPIESIGYDFCGNGRFRKKIMPGEYLMFLLPKYSGSEKTLLRVRFKIGENIFISQSFEGFIHPEQFLIDTTDWVHDRLVESKGLYYHEIFYGAAPREMDKYEKKND